MREFARKTPHTTSVTIYLHTCAIDMRLEVPEEQFHARIYKKSTGDISRVGVHLI